MSRRGTLSRLPPGLTLTLTAWPGLNETPRHGRSSLWDDPQSSRKAYRRLRFGATGPPARRELSSWSACLLASRIAQAIEGHSSTRGIDSLTLVGTYAARRTMVLAAEWASR